MCFIVSSNYDSVLSLKICFGSMYCSITSMHVLCLLNIFLHSTSRFYLKFMALLLISSKLELSSLIHLVGKKSVSSMHHFANMSSA